jgi:hypothetical protein
LIFVFGGTAFNKIGEIYFPLERGRSWEYTVDKVYNNIDKQIKYKMLVKNLGEHKFGKMAAPSREYTYQNDTEDVYFQYYAEDYKGIYLVADRKKTDSQPKIKNPPLYTLIYPIKVGTSLKEDITYGYKITKIVSINESITVKAGTFTNCLKFKTEVHISGGGITTSTHWLAPKVGLVKSIIVGEGKYGATITTELISYSK